jgi:hypothetical protein
LPASLWLEWRRCGAVVEQGKAIVAANSLLTQTRAAALLRMLTWRRSTMRRTFAMLLAWLGLVSLLGSHRPAGAAAVTGTWKLTLETKNAPVEVILKLNQEGEKLTGTATGPDGKELPIQDGTLKGSDLQFAVSVERDGAPVKHTVKATLNGESLKGSVDGFSDGPIAFTGARQAAEATGATEALTGTWNLTIEATNQTYHPTVTLAQEGEKLTGTLKTEDGTEAKVMNGSLKGDAVSFAVDLTINDRDLHLEFTGKRNGKGLKGDLHVGDMTVPWSGERAPQPAAK